MCVYVYVRACVCVCSSDVHKWQMDHCKEVSLSFLFVSVVSDASVGQLNFRTWTSFRAPAAFRSFSAFPSSQWVWKLLHNNILMRRLLEVYLMLLQYQLCQIYGKKLHNGTFISALFEISINIKHLWITRHWNC